MKKSESELAAKVVKWLRDQRWDVYQEVQVSTYGGVADIVAKLDNLVWVIETKTSFSLDVIGQAQGWKRCAHFVSVGVPSTKRQGSGRLMAKLICKQWGVGVLEVGMRNNPVIQTIAPSINRTAKTSPFADLHDMQKLDIAGTFGGGHWTPFKNTCYNVKRYVEDNPGVDLKTLVDGVSHHYGSSSCARACVSKYAKDGIVPGVRCERDGKFLKFYLDTTEDPQ